MYLLKFRKNDYESMGSHDSEMFACKAIKQLSIDYNTKVIDIYTFYDGIRCFNKGKYKGKYNAKKKFC